MYILLSVRGTSLGLLLFVIVQCGCNIFSSTRLVQKTAEQEVTMLDSLQAFINRESDAKRHVHATVKT